MKAFHTGKNSDKSLPPLFCSSLSKLDLTLDHFSINNESQKLWMPDQPLESLSGIKAVRDPGSPPPPSFTSQMV